MALVIIFHTVADNIELTFETREKRYFKNYRYFRESIPNFAD